MTTENSQIASRDKKGELNQNSPSLLSLISEDIWAVWIGGLLIVAILLVAFISTDLKFSTPVYQWATADDLTTKVLTGKNLLLIVIIGIVFFLLSSVAIVASGKWIKKYLWGFFIGYR